MPLVQARSRRGTGAAQRSCHHGQTTTLGPVPGLLAPPIREVGLDHSSKPAGSHRLPHRQPPSRRLTSWINAGLPNQL